ncbi:IPTL-CTERM sorting domain-containing protein [Ottowia thiooxydans]|uniref:IPTL-CTERM sorting domain-containing protein n=1 Tax=Ottowia thiooxydans TaxID=219182 RepID=A0ABV2Q6K5_9BURK
MIKSIRSLALATPASRHTRVAKPRARLRAAVLLGGTLLAMMGAMPVHAEIPSTERQALLALYTSAGGANWSNKTNWGGAVGTECTWHGVSCDVANTHVTALRLNFNNLIGTVPASLGTLSELTVLNLRQSDLSGPIPALSGLSKLVTLDLSNNRFSGQIPALTGLGSLQSFQVQGGQLTGSTPSLAGLTSLKVFNVAGNLLDGQIGPLSGATALEEFHVRNNKLVGAIPDLSGLAALTSFDASNNQLTALTSFGGIANLDSFIASQNQLKGSIPALAGLSKLRSFHVDYNQLSGPIPPLSDLVNLEHFYVRDNALTGQIPSLIGLTKLRAFWIQNNQLVGAPPLPPNQTMVAVPCPNPLRNSTDPAINLAWDNAVTGSSPWATGCTGSWDVTPTVRDAYNGRPITDGSTGTISPDTTQIMPAGGSVQFTMTPAAGYRLRTPIGSSCPGGLNGHIFTAGPLTANCAVDAVFVRDASPDDGACGSDNGKTLSLPPTNLCSVGTASAITGTGPWTWSCAGTGSGVTAQCSAQKAGQVQNWTVTAVVDGAGGTAAPETQSVANGARASVVGTPASGYMLTGASGCTSTTVAGNTATTVPVTADCTVTLNFGLAQQTNTQFVSVAPTTPNTGDAVLVRISVSAGDTAVTNGTVTIHGGGASCAAQLNAEGDGQCTMRFQTGGEHQLTAAYPGDLAQRYLPSSAVYAVTVVGSVANLKAVPTLSQWVLLLLAALMLLVALRRRIR